MSPRLLPVDALSGLGFGRSRIGCSRLDPEGEVVGDGLWEPLAFWGHLKIVLMAERFDDQAFIGIGEVDGRACVAAFEETVFGVEDQATFYLLGR